MFQNAAVGVNADSDVYFGIGGDLGKSFDGVAVERIQQPNDVPVYLVLATFDLAACLFAALLKWHSIHILLRRLYRRWRNRTTWDVHQKVLSVSRKAL